MSFRIDRIRRPSVPAALDPLPAVTPVGRRDRRDEDEHQDAPPEDPPARDPDDDGGLHVDVLA